MKRITVFIVISDTLYLMHFTVCFADKYCLFYSLFYVNTSYASYTGDHVLVRRSSNSLCSSSSEETRKVGSTETCHWVPSGSGWETVGSTSRVISSGDIEECRGVGVQEWVQEAKRTLAGCNKPVVDQRDDTGEDWGRARSSVDKACSASVEDLDVLALGSNIRESATSSAESARVGASKCREISRYDAGLVRGASKDVGEPSAGE